MRRKKRQAATTTPATTMNSTTEYYCLKHVVLGSTVRSCAPKVLTSPALMR